MRWNWRRTLPWAALAALALLAVSAVPHLHAEVEGAEECCALCHAQDTPSVAAWLPANPDPAIRAAAVPVPLPHVRGTTPTGGGGSRASPA